MVRSCGGVAAEVRAFLTTLRFSRPGKPNDNAHRI